MATMRGSRLAVGSSPWIAEERAAATQITESEVEEFSFSARNDFEWLNEHMAGIFDENEMQVGRFHLTVEVATNQFIATWPRFSRPQENCEDGRPGLRGS